MTQEYDGGRFVGPVVPETDVLLEANERPWCVLADPGRHTPHRAELGSHSIMRAGDEVWLLSSVAVAYGQEEDGAWLKAGTQFPRARANGPELAERYMVDRLALQAAEIADGEALVDRDGMLARIEARRREAAVGWEPALLVIDGEAVPALRRVLGRHEMVYAAVAGEVAFVQSHGWAGSTELVHTLDRDTLSV